MSFICGIFWRLRVNNWLVLNPLIVQYVCDCRITPFLNVKKHVRTFVFDKHIQTVHNPSRILVPIQCTSIKFKLKNHSFFCLHVLPTIFHGAIKLWERCRVCMWVSVYFVSHFLSFWFYCKWHIEICMVLTLLQFMFWF